jgi:DNA polymerase elongation subunit (family B)
LAYQVPQVIELIQDRMETLRARQVDYRDLVLTYRLTRDPAEYRHNTLNAIVARQLVRGGVRLRPGESIQYIVTDAHAPCPDDRAQAFELFDSKRDYDVDQYADLLLRAMETILQPAGLNRKQIEQSIAQKQTGPIAWQVPLDSVFAYEKRNTCRVQ